MALVGGTLYAVLGNSSGDRNNGVFHTNNPTSNVPIWYVGDPTNPKVVHGYATAFLKQIEPVFPGITRRWNGRATLDVPERDPNLLGSYSYWKVGQYTQFSGYEKARQPDPTTGKCHFAGEHCSTNFQGYMEGGAEQGARAANEIVSDYKAGILP